MAKKNHGNGTIVITTYMPADRAVKFKKAAASEELSISQLVNRVVKKYLEERVGA